MNDTILGHDLTSKMVMMKLDDKTLASVCGSNKVMNELCNETFWRDRFKLYFPDVEVDKINTISWKIYYIIYTLIYQIVNSQNKSKEILKLAKFITELELSKSEFTELVTLISNEMEELELTSNNREAFRHYTIIYLLKKDNLDYALILAHDLYEELKYGSSDIMRRYANFLQDQLDLANDNVQDYRRNISDLREMITQFSNEQIRGYLESRIGSKYLKDFGLFLDLVEHRKYDAANILLYNNVDLKNEIVDYFIKRMYYGITTIKLRNILNYCIRNSFPFTYDKLLHWMENHERHIDTDTLAEILKAYMEVGLYPNKDDTQRLFDRTAPVNYERLRIIYSGFGLSNLIPEEFW